MSQSFKRIMFPSKFSYTSPKATISIASPDQSIRQTWAYPQNFKDEFRNRNYSNNLSDYTIQDSTHKNQVSDDYLRNTDIQNKRKINSYSKSAKAILSPYLRQSLQNYKDGIINSKIVC